MSSKIETTTPHNPTESREINTINLEDNEPLVEHTLGQSHSTLSSRKSEAISDPGSISTTSLFKKPITFAPNLEWTVDQPVNTIIYNNDLLSIFETLSLSPGGQALRAHTFFRSGAKVQIKLTSSPFHAGKLIFYYIPPGVRTQFRESVFAKAQYPCVYVDAANSTTAELDIPFVLIKDFLATYNPDAYSDFGQISVAVFNQLAIGTGGPTMVNFALSLHPTENQISLPVLAHDIELQGAFIPAAMMLAEAMPGLLEGAIPAITAGAAGVIAGGGAEMILNGSASEQFEDKNFDKGAKYALNNLDVNTNNTTSHKDINQSAPSLSNMTGLGTEHLSLYPERTAVKTYSSHSTFDDEMNLQRIAMVPSLLQMRSWADTDTPNTILFRTSIDPMVSPISALGDTFTTYPTYLTHVTTPFAYWRGSIDYHFTFASTEQHKGKVIAAWIPYDSSSTGESNILPTPTVETLSLFPNEIFDLSMNKEFNFSVPYNTETPYRYVNEVSGRMPNDNTNFADLYSSNYSLGSLILMVYNRLSHPTTVTPTIQFNVYVKAGNDYQVRGLKFARNQGGNYQRIRYVELQGLFVENETSRGGITKLPENRVGMTNAGLSSTSFQEDNTEHSLDKLLSKYYPQVALSFTVGASSTRKLRVASLPGLVQRMQRDTTNSTPDPKWRNLIAHFRDIYAFWHGSLNYFIIHNTTVNTPVLLMTSHDPTDFAMQNLQVTNGSLSDATNAWYSPIEQDTVESDDNADVSETSIYSHISNLRVNPTVEITTPYRSIYRRLYTVDNFLPVAQDTADQDNSLGVLDLIYSNPSVTDISLSATIFQSVGSDFRFKYLIPPPSLQTRND